MELKWLEDFVAVAQSASFSRAADNRHVTQSAFSRRIKQLENWVGAPLINRATVPAQLTPAGEHWLPVAQDVIHTLYSARESLGSTNEQAAIRIAALHTLTVVFFPRWLRRIEQHINVGRTLVIPDRGGIEANLAALVDAEADFFLTYAHDSVPLHLDNRRFQVAIVGRDRLMPVCAPTIRTRDGVQAGHSSLERALDRHEPLPYLGYGTSSFFGVALQQLFAARPKFSRHTVHENMISAGLKNLTMTGSGVCWLPRSLVEAELRDGTLVAATTNTAWMLDLDIVLYRAPEQRTARADTFWQTATTLT